MRVLALTVHEEETYLRQLLKAGAAGYVLKRTASEELIGAIRWVAAGGVYLDPNVAGKVVTGFLESTAPVAAILILASAASVRGVNVLVV